jgi:EAL domain-containing protein (putative c-di-GMP-specific phosphodiesterase class I)
MNIIQPKSSGPACGACKDGSSKPFAFSMAFQPIVHIGTQKVFAYEALVRGPNGESAHSVLSQVTEENRYAFDQNCRIAAISLASKLGIARQGANLSVNFLPGAVYSPSACLQKTLQTAQETGFPLENLMFEITEDERVGDAAHLQRIIVEYRKFGFSIALDDFGAGFSGLNLLSEILVDTIKLDLRLIRDIDKRPRAAAIVRSTVNLCRELGVEVIAECVETVEEYELLRSMGIDLMQGYLFAKPMFEELPQVNWPERIASKPMLPFDQGQALQLMSA